MASIAFYHAQGETPGAVDALLPPLLEKALATGLHAAVVCPTAQRAQRLDETLWTYADAAFLPHAVVPLAEGTDAKPAHTQKDFPPEQHPVLLLALEEAPDAIPPSLVQGRLPLLLAGAEGALSQTLEAGAEKVFYLFSAAPADVERARTLWKTLKSAAHTLTYWQKTEKGWEKKA